MGSAGPAEPAATPCCSAPAAPFQTLTGRPLIGNGANGTPGTGADGGAGGWLFGNGGNGGSGA
ncbi:hypothetical protein C3937_01525, partial [Mycobacterium tuberculosis]